MPHMSPLSWITLYLLFWSVLIIIMAGSWWVSPSFKTSYSHNKKKSSWYWC